MRHRSRAGKDKGSFTCGSSNPRAAWVARPTLGCAAAAVGRPCSARSPSRVGSELQNRLCQHGSTFGRNVIAWWRQFLSDAKLVGHPGWLHNSDISTLNKEFMPWCMPDAQKDCSMCSKPITPPRGGIKGWCSLKLSLGPHYGQELPVGPVDARALVLCRTTTTTAAHALMGNVEVGFSGFHLDDQGLETETAISAAVERSADEQRAQATLELTWRRRDIWSETKHAPS